jgi:6-pyruvoyl-tetrahydropterin synthase
MNNKLQPNWQPIKNMSMIANLIDSQLTDAKEQYITLSEARNKPYVLNDSIVQRTIKVYTEQLDFTQVFEKQLLKWKNEEYLKPIQQIEICRLQEQVKQSYKTLTDILDLSEELKSGTIEKVMEKSDLELGIESLKKYF